MNLTTEISIEWNTKLKEPEELRLLQSKFLKKYHLKQDDISSFSIQKKSLDARKKPCIIARYKVLFTCDNTMGTRLLKKEKGILHSQDDSPYYVSEASKQAMKKRPIVIGTGPAGLFAGYYLSLAGLCPILIEQGKNVDEREKDIQAFWNGIVSEVNNYSNVQFGEGGAGTFSDGKLATGVKDPYGRIQYILKTFVKFGADPAILYDSKPHIGTDVLKQVVKNMRLAMEGLGATFCFETLFLDIKSSGGRIHSILVKNIANNVEEEIPCEQLVLCTGHSARNTFFKLHDSGIAMENKPFAVGFRLIHPQKLWNHIQYGEGYEKKGLPAADYKITYHTASGRSFYSFCMCPGGYVVNASSIPGLTCVNGMSYHGRNSDSANSAMVLNVSENDYGFNLFDGVAFQNQLEKAAFTAGCGKIPIETLGEFSKDFGKLDVCSINKAEYFENFIPSIKGESINTSLAEILPEALNQELLEGIAGVGTKIAGFNHPSAVLCGVESRTSSPVKILRDDNYESSIHGVYPCGEGAGYAGGITSAALDGLKVAEIVVKHYNL